MKEQDAAHSFEKIPWGKQEDIDALNAELTRLRSELKNLDTIRKEEFKVLSRENTKLASELQQERELRKDYKKMIEELIPLAVKSRISVDMPYWEKEQGSKKATINRARKLIDKL